MTWLGDAVALDVGAADGVDVGLREEAWLGDDVGLGLTAALGVPVTVGDPLCVKLGVFAEDADCVCDALVVALGVAAALNDCV